MKKSSTPCVYPYNYGYLKLTIFYNTIRNCHNKKEIDMD